ncbi:MAG: 30S ribosomal protein S16 [Anaerolineae bacterium]|nr:30S ribosomal protein S16 [Anaerolineae bacterium]
MVKIRLRRTGAKKQPSYRVVISDSRTSRDGRFIETIGFYNPTTEPTTVNIHEDRALYWLSVGAQPTDVVKKLLNNAGTMDKLSRLKEGEALESLLAGANDNAVTAQQKNEEVPSKTENVKEEVNEEAEAVAD